MNWTPEQVEEVEKNIRQMIAQDRGARGPVRPPLRKPDRKAEPRKPPPAIIVKSSKATATGMNNLERRFQDDLKMRQYAGEVVWFDFEPLRFKLATFMQNGAPRTIWYTPDFVALTKLEGELICYEVKGFWREASRVRIKLAASHYPFEFVAVTREHGEWKYEVFQNGDPCTRKS